MKGKKYWQINTEKLAEEIKEKARKSKTEEELKMGMEPLLQKTFKKMGIDITQIFQFGIANCKVKIEKCKIEEEKQSSLKMFVYLQSMYFNTHKSKYSAT